MTAINKTARFAGLLYLMLVISAIINLKYIPSQLVVWESASEAFENIKKSELLFRLGIVSGIITYLIFLLLPLILYKLLNKISEVHAKLMVLFALISVPISFTIILNKFSILSLINSEYIEHIGGAELYAQVMLYLGYYNNGIEILQIFWGLWLFPFGYLVYKSGFLPKILGILLMVGCFGYLITFFGGFLYSDFYKTTFSTIIGIPASIGEIGICLWLLIMGTNIPSIGKTAENKIN
ncbi:DUF4386 domain-containing protein [Flavivirga algicola]|uniref:DUF4386 domain-containing protein n=1 Tax=Flavivirga algicola TaxID=2729136 RepID=A0ABX1S531_9FLAO|nr:DUF4386 domain-containing protein [Flavivirga algicola]NMH89859.1 DUF4386 domain-containing protein [Flavivirga algicola]